MGIAWTEDHPYKQEMDKWNKAYVYAEFPRMMFKALKRPDGRVSVGEAEDEAGRAPWGGQFGFAEAFTKRCQRTVLTEDEKKAALNDGWRLTQPEALEYFEKLEQERGNVAAHRHHEDRNLGERAKAEAEAADAATSEHLAAIPETPVKRRGRKPGSKNKPKTETVQ